MDLPSLDIPAYPNCYLLLFIFVAIFLPAAPLPILLHPSLLYSTLSPRIHTFFSSTFFFFFFFCFFSFILLLSPLSSIPHSCLLLSTDLRLSSDCLSFQQLQALIAHLHFPSPSAIPLSLSPWSMISSLTSLTTSTPIPS